MPFRTFNDGDRKAVHRIWREAGWIEAGDEKTMDLMVDAGRALVADVDGVAECLVLSAPGTVRHLADDLPMSCVTGVTTSRVARKQGFAGRLTARAIAADVAEGAIVSSLGMFEQGFYNKLGFGTGGYEKIVSLDPKRLRLPGDAHHRVPRRITTDDWEAVHANRLDRGLCHGACRLSPPGLTHADMLDGENGFGLGFSDGPDGPLTHHLWCSISDDVEVGPYKVEWMAWRTPAQFVELLAVLRGLGDQVHAVRLREPAGIQLQDLVTKPFERYIISRKSDLETAVRAVAYWQMRICDLPACMARTHLRGGDLKLNVRVADPIESLLDDGERWRGVAGDYVVTLGASSGAENGHDATLPTLATTVNAFTRMWLGVRPATGLAITDDLHGPPDLLEELDHVLRLPDPHPDWEF